MPDQGTRKLFDIESPMAVELRRIMIRLGRRTDLDRKRALMVTSSQRGEGKSLFSLNFSLILAYHLQKKILLIDGDVRRPVQHGVFQVPLSPGFTEALRGDLPAGEAVRKTRIENLYFMPAGAAGTHPSRIFGGHQVKGLVQELHRGYDIVIIDSPPVVPVSDPLHYIEAVDGAIYLVMAGQTPRDIVVRGVEILRGAGANILGVVANNMSEVLPYYYDRKYYAPSAPVSPPSS
jgi:capsular exopolysaccharide synthesis family protein